MITALVISQMVTWLLMIAIIVALLAIARQVGVLHERVAPIGALTPKQGPAVGSKAPRLQSTALDGRIVEIGGALPPGARRMLFFISAQCPICKKLIPFAKSFAAAENVDLIFAGDDNPDIQRKLVSDAGLTGYGFLNDAVLGRSFAVDKLPHAVLLADDGTIISRGLVNSREHLESMIVAAETGMSSVQEFIASRASQSAR